MAKPDDIALSVRDQLCIDCVCTFRDGCGCTDAIAAAIEAAILAERERCARRLEAVDGYFNPPGGFYEALQANTKDDGFGFRTMDGDTGNWAAFMVEILKPWAAAIRNPNT